ncbi:hypothetical protein CERSUDRAFT_100955 [Gelatoporia subvermispora B]|nr:hypothetical protein CERSUDRAFT_100955 [Gelatoporia subvermispora B]
MRRRGRPRPPVPSDGVGLLLRLKSEGATFASTTTPAGRAHLVDTPPRTLTGRTEFCNYIDHYRCRRRQACACPASPCTPNLGTSTRYAICCARREQGDERRTFVRAPPV